MGYQVDREVRFPQGARPQCNHYSGRTRCPNPAAVLVYAPDSRPVPGGYECAACAERISAEYRKKLGEVWMMRPLVEVRS